MTPLKEIRTGESITAAWLNTIIRRLRELTPQPSGDILPSTQPGGTTYKLKRLGASSSTEKPEKRPFLVYRALPLSGGSSTTDWRNVHVHAGQINGISPTGSSGDFATDNASSHVDILVPTNSDEFVIFLECDVENDPDDLGTLGTITNVALSASASGWGGYPAQPAGDSDTGAPADKLYVRLATVTSGVDSPDDDDDYRFLQINQFVTSSLGADLITYSFTCNATRGYIPVQRMAVWAQ